MVYTLDSSAATRKDHPMSEAPDYAFPHAAADESRRLELFQQRLDPLTMRRIERLGVGAGAACLEVGGGRGSITRWLAERVGSSGNVIATDLQVDLTSIDAPNVEGLRHDFRTDTFPGSVVRSHPHTCRAHAHSRRPRNPPADGLVASSGRLAAARRAGLRHVARRRRPRLGNTSGRLAPDVPER